MREFFSIKVKTINEVVQEFPPTLNFFCDDVIPLGPDLVREIGSPNECIAVYKLFMFEQGGDRYGTEEVKTMEEWRQYFNAGCKCCS